MTPDVPSLADIRAARERIAGTAVRTPLLQWHDAAVSARIFLKLESLQPIGSFKIRGAANAIARLNPEQLERGVLTASAGNMAQGVAWCARQRGIPCTVVAPDTAPRTKIEAVERLGGRVILAPFDVWWRTFQDRSYPGVDATFVHAFDDLDVMAGNGTIGLEILEDLPDVDAIVVPWGGGGLSCGIAAAVRALRPDCRVWAAEVATSAPLSASLEAGRPVTIVHEPTFVDGIGGKGVFPRMFELARELIAGSLVASLEDVASSVRLLAERQRIIAEGAGACALAAALRGGAGDGTVACIVSGGNIEASSLCAILEGRLPSRS